MTSQQGEWKCNTTIRGWWWCLDCNRKGLFPDFISCPPFFFLFFSRGDGRNSGWSRKKIYMEWRSQYEKRRGGRGSDGGSCISLYLCVVAFGGQVRPVMASNIIRWSAQSVNRLLWLLAFPSLLFFLSFWQVKSSRLLSLFSSLHPLCFIPVFSILPSFSFET